MTAGALQRSTEPIRCCLLSPFVSEGLRITTDNTAHCALCRVVEQLLPGSVGALAGGSQHHAGCGTHNLSPHCRFDATQMRKKAAETTRWKDVPHLDEPFIHQNLKHMVALQIIGPPGQTLTGSQAPAIQ